MGEGTGNGGRSPFTLLLFSMSLLVLGLGLGLTGWPQHPGPHPCSNGLTATHPLCAGFDSPSSTPISTPPSTCSPRLGDSSSTGTNGRPSTAVHPPLTSTLVNRRKRVVSPSPQNFFSGDVPVTFPGDVRAVFQWPLGPCSNVVGTSCWNVAGTKKRTTLFARPLCTTCTTTPGAGGGGGSIGHCPAGFG